MQGIMQLEKRLKEFVEQTEGIRGVIISTPEGLPFSYYSSGKFDADLIAAITSSIFALAKKSGRAADLGLPNEITIHMEDGSLYIFPLGSLVFGILTLPGAMTGMVLVNARKILGDLEKLEI